MYDYDLLIIGAGAAGSDAAMTARKLGKTVGLIEQDKLGGTCLNYGCDPTKALLHTANLLFAAQHAQHYGLSIPEASVDWQQVQQHIQRGISTIRGGTHKQAVESLQKQGIDVMLGHAVLHTPHSVLFAEREISAEHILLACGCETVAPPLPGLHESGFLTNKEAVALQHLPRSLAVIGGGPIGLEFTQLFQRFGVQVTLLEQHPTLLPQEEPILVDQLQSILKQEGIHIETGIHIERVDQTSGGQKRVTFTREHQSLQVEVDQLLLASGRRPAVQDLQLEKVGISLTETGGIEVDATLRTQVTSIWAVGDVLGTYQFTHVASEQARFVVENIFSAHPHPFEYPAVPWVTYTDPPLAHIGETEQTLQKKKIHYRSSTFQLDQVARAIANDQREGTIKVLATPEGALLGAHILGHGADDMLALFVLAINERIPLQRLATLMLPYPTLAEAVRWSADAWVKTGTDN